MITNENEERSKNAIGFLLSQIEQIIQAPESGRTDMEKLVLTCMDDAYNRRMRIVGCQSPSSQKLSLPPFLTRKLIGYIADHLSTNIRLIDMANQVGLSPYHFSRVFKMVFGTSPYQYILMRRIKMAKEMMLKQDTNLLGIAIAVGFSGAGQFSRAFRKMTGMTPSQWRGKADEVKSLLKKFSSSYRV